MAKRLMLLEGAAKAAGPAAPIRSRVARYLARRGFSSQPPGPAKAMIFKRGSSFGSSTSFSPAKWEVTLTVTAEAEDWKTTFEVNTTGQTVTDNERVFWAEESAALVDVIEGREPQPLGVIEKQVASQLPRMIILAFAYGLGFALLGLVVEFMMRSNGAGLSSPMTIPMIAMGLGISMGMRQGMLRAPR